MNQIQSNEEKLKGIQDRWRKRIVKECERMAKAIVALQDLAEKSGNDTLKQEVDRFHEIYCDMVNALEVRVLLNGVARELCRSEQFSDFRET